MSATIKILRSTGGSNLIFLALLLAALLPATTLALGPNNPPQVIDDTITFLTQWGSSGSGNGQFSNLKAVAVDSAGNVYVADTNNNRIQKFDSSGAYLTQWGSNGSGNGQFNSPRGVAVDSADNIYVADTNNKRIQKFDSSGIYLTKWGSSGSGNGQFNSPRGVAVDSAGNVYVVDSSNNRIQKFDSSGTYLTKWGSFGSGNGQFDFPSGVAVDSAGNVYVADPENDRIQKFDSSGAYLTQWGSNGSGNGQFYFPSGVAVDSAGNVYVADTENNRIQKFDSSGVYLTQRGSNGSGNGQFSSPCGVAVDSAGNVYVADTSNNRVQKFSTASPINTTSVTMSEDSSPTLFSLTLNATDPDNDPITWSVDTQAGHGTASASGTGITKTISYSPTTNYTGGDSFIVQVSDGALTNTITVNVTLTPVNDAPLYTSVPVMAVNVTQPYTYQVTANDVDTSDTLTITALTRPGWLALVDHGSGVATLNGIPGQADIGEHAVALQVTDSAGLTATQSFTIGVTAQPFVYLYLPLVVKDISPGADLMVDSLSAGAGGVSLTIRNAGDSPTPNAFWVDVYFDPNPAPPHLNQPWNTIAPAGAVWGVTKILASGESLTLTSGGSYYDPSRSSSSFPAGAQVYAFVDSINFSTTYGNVQEGNENNNVFGPVVASAAARIGPKTAAEPASLEGLPGR